MLSTLYDMLTYRRPAGSRSEKAFIRRFIRPLPGATIDRFGNWSVVIGDAPSIVFSAHTDTMHKLEGRQTIDVSADGLVTLRETRVTRNYRMNDRTYSLTEAPGGCLGADDAAGIYVLLQLIQAQVPGRYIFHRSEERGGIGSSRLVASRPDWLKDIRQCVAFDRRGTDDVITSQAGGTCASNAYGYALAGALNTQNALFNFSPADGIFTDTANYAEDVPECTNISIGYSHEHTSDESVYAPFVDMVAQAAIALDWGALPIERIPGDPCDWRSFGWGSSEPLSYTDAGTTCRVCGCDTAQYCAQDTRYLECLDCGHLWKESVYLTQDHEDVQNALNEAFRHYREDAR